MIRCFMILTEKQILDLSFGSVKKFVKDGLVHFQKCTDKQVSAWYKIRQDLGGRAEATTGVKLDFVTDGDKLVFSFIKGRKVEVYIDNLFRGQFLMDEYRAKNAKVEIPITDTLGKPYGEARVTVYFPAHDEPGVIDYFEVSNATFVKPHKHDIKFLFIGDSITQGWETMTDTLSYAQKTTRFFNAESVINGVGGAIFAEETFDSIDFAPDVVILAYGTNDFGYWKSADEMLSHIKGYMSLVAKEYAGKKLFAISPVWRRDYDRICDTGTFPEARDRVISVAKELGFTHIDGLKMIPPIADYFTDNVHPNELGFAFYSDNLIAELKKYL